MFPEELLHSLIKFEAVLFIREDVALILLD